MFTIERALAVMGDRDTITSAELVRALDPHWLRRGSTPNQAMQRAGKELSYAFGPTVKPERVRTERGHRSVYHRADLEAALGNVSQTTHAQPAPVVSPQPAARPVELPAGIILCPHCGQPTPEGSGTCWRAGCGKKL